MSLAKYLESKKAQSIIEYVATFIILVAAILVVARFGAFNPDNSGMRNPMNSAVTRAIDRLNK